MSPACASCCLECSNGTATVHSVLSHLVLLISKVAHGLRLGHPGVPHHSIREACLVHLYHSPAATVSDLYLSTQPGKWAAERVSSSATAPGKRIGTNRCKRGSNTCMPSKAVLLCHHKLCRDMSQNRSHGPESPEDNQWRPTHPRLQLIWTHLHSRVWHCQVNTVNLLVKNDIARLLHALTALQAVCICQPVQA